MLTLSRAVAAGLVMTALASAPVASQTPNAPPPEAQPAPQIEPPAPGPDAAACGERLERFIRSMSERFDGARLSSEAQRRAYEAFKSAAAKAQDFVREACATESSAANIQQLEAAEQQMAKALDGLRPALQNFYSSLSDEQKAQINSLGRQLELWAKDFWGDFLRDAARQLRERQAQRPGSQQEGLKFCIEGFCLSVPEEFVDGRRDRNRREPENPDRL